MKQKTYFLHQGYFEQGAVYVRLGLDFVKLFGDRNWNLYTADERMDSLESFKEIVRQGPVALAKEFQQYFLLPKTVSPKDADELIRLLQNGQARYPFFLDLYDKEENGIIETYCNGVYLIDTVMFSPDSVQFRIDLDAMLFLGMKIPDNIAAYNDPCIAFKTIDMYDKISQVTKPYSPEADTLFDSSGIGVTADIYQ
jgi:hypothetical protein